MLLRAIVTQLILPPTLNLVLLILGLLLGLRQRTLGRILVWFSVSTLFLLSVPWVKEQIYLPLENRPPVRIADIKALDPAHTAMVVLGGGLREYVPEFSTPAAGDSSVRRLLYAHHLLQQVKLPVLISGGHPRDTRVTVASRMGELLQQLGDNPRWLEEASRTTWENAVDSAAWLKRNDIQTVVLVTDAWHMRRSVQSFVAQGLNVVAAPTGYRSTTPDGVLAWLPEAKSFHESVTAIHEWLGLLMYHFSYGTTAAPPTGPNGVIPVRAR